MPESLQEGRKELLKPVSSNSNGRQPSSSNGSFNRRRRQTGRAARQVNALFLPLPLPSQKLEWHFIKEKRDQITSPGAAPHRADGLQPAIGKVQIAETTAKSTAEGSDSRSRSQQRSDNRSSPPLHMQAGPAKLQERPKACTASPASHPPGRVDSGSVNCSSSSSFGRALVRSANFSSNNSFGNALVRSAICKDQQAS